MGSMPLPRKFHGEHNGNHYGLPSTFLLNGFVFKKSFLSRKMASHEVKG